MARTPAKRVKRSPVNGDSKKKKLQRVLPGKPLPKPTSQPKARPKGTRDKMNIPKKQLIRKRKSVVKT